MIAWEATIVALIGSVAGIWPGAVLGKALVADPKHRPAFRTKLELAVELLRWAGWRRLGGGDR